MIYTYLTIIVHYPIQTEFFNERLLIYNFTFILIYIHIFIIIA